jgi:hypothetical protein
MVACMQADGAWAGMQARSNVGGTGKKMGVKGWYKIDSLRSQVRQRYQPLHPSKGEAKTGGTEHVYTPFACPLTPAHIEQFSYPPTSYCHHAFHTLCCHLGPSSPGNFCKCPANQAR